MDLSYFKDRYQELQGTAMQDSLSSFRAQNFAAFEQQELPNHRNEEWKYTPVRSLFEPSYAASLATIQLNNTQMLTEELDAMRIPGHHKANQLVFVNGQYTPELSTLLSDSQDLEILPLSTASDGAYKEIVRAYLNKSSDYIKDGVHALNGALLNDGLFMYVPKGKTPPPLYIYHILDGRLTPVMAQPRCLVYAAENSKLQLTEVYKTLGNADSFCNEVMEIVVAQDALVEYYKIQNDKASASQVGTTHITQTGKSYVHAVTVTLNGGILRNNLNLVLDAANNEAHMYGLYLLKGNTHADNHTLIDNKQPGCLSNQLYKGIADDCSTAVFNGRIMVQPDAQKTNAYQSNKNILLSDHATVNAKPQLEIFADDVKCSHGCTVGQLDQEALFYLRARGVPKAQAEVLLLQAYSADIVAQIRPMALRVYVEKLILAHLSIA